MILDKKPIYCIECGKTMKDLPTIEYDPQTGEKVNKGVFLMRCKDEWCSHFAAMTTDGRWKT